MNTSISIILYTSKTLSNGEHPLMLRLSKDGRRKYISLKISLNPIYWDNNRERPKKNCPNREQINELITRKIKEFENQVINFKSTEKEYTLSSLIGKASATEKKNIL